ncbi:MAG: amino acid ABC transporter permease [Actinobacteria bacterium]|nr:amino acid ABC transporter permease [Actinomycetota bacterium]MTB05260.1 amino acid ABC transporter permease [Actinomycetota bacterium]
MMDFLNTLLIGITAGSIYSLMAISMVLVWRSTRVVNFAQAGMALLSTYFGFEAVTRLGSFWIALPVAMVGGALVAALVEMILIRLLVKHSSSGPIAGVAPIIATLGLLGVIRASTSMIWGGQDVRIVGPVSNDGYTINGTTLVFSPLKLLILLTVLVLMLILSLVFQKTNIGLALRASAYSPEIARLSGIKVDWVRTLGWALAGAAGAVAGMFQTVNGNGTLSPDSIEFSLLLVSGFIAAVIGGLDSLIGAVIGGLVLGLMISFVLMYISSGLFFIAPFVILLLVLFIRPQGIFGAKAARRA